MGVDHLSKIKSVKPKKIKKKQKYILFVGRLNNRKNILTLINAFNSLKNEYLKLVIVGQKSHKFKNFNNLIKQKKLTKKIIMIANSTDSNIKWLYKNALIFCSPSFAEGFGLPPIEAMSQGCNTITSNIPSHKEICGSSTVYFNPKNFLELSNKIKLLINNKKYRTTLIKKGKKRSNLFFWKKTCNKLLSSLEKSFK